MNGPSLQGYDHNTGLRCLLRNSGGARACQRRLHGREPNKIGIRDWISCFLGAHKSIRLFFCKNKIRIHQSQDRSFDFDALLVRCFACHFGHFDA